MAQPLAKLFSDICLGHVSLTEAKDTSHEMIWVPDTRYQLTSISAIDGKERRYDLGLDGRFGSAAMRMIKDDGHNIGFIVLARRKVAAFEESDVEILAFIGQILGMALENQAAQAQLRERIKELQCLYEVVRLGEQPGASIEQILEGVVRLLPPAWQYPEIAAARITFDACSFQTEGFVDDNESMSSDIIVGEEKRGEIEVSYQEERPVLYEGPFLKEERHLIDALAREISGLIERRLGQEEKRRLEEQLRHADRLATIGQLGAGVAHELNEPLANILGFAQLAQKCPGLPDQAGKDLERIERASLYAREVIKKLLIFSRQMPSSKAQINLNQLVREGASFFENRCAKEGIEIELRLEPNLPEITADPSQLYQVLINLVMNAVQAMPEGGHLTLRTSGLDDGVSLVVEDTGVGMNDEVKKQLFVPFFTTKGVDEGTGLGLAVVHGIVSAHDGTIDVQSDVGCGTRMQVRLPLEGAHKSSPKPEAKDDD